MSVREMKAGDAAFLAKQFSDQVRVEVSHLALERDRATRQREAEIATLRDRFESLTPREREVLPWVVSGLLNKQIADAMGTSAATVKVHRNSCEKWVRSP